jgi:MFS transporter, DHA3 family, macrolide efflux protein
VTSAPVQIAADLPPLTKDWAVQTWVGASFVSFAGDSIFTISFAWAAVHEASPALAGFIVGVGTIPQALVLLFGGAIADRFNTRRIVLVGNVVRVLILIAGASAWQADAPRIPVMFAVAIAFGITDAIYNPASSTLPRQMLRVDDLGRVSGMFQVTRRLANFAGAAIGGWLAAVFGLGIAMIVDAATFAIVGIALWVFVRPRFALPRAASPSVLRDIREGLGYVKRDEVARTFVIALTGLNLFIGPALAVGVALRVSQSGWGAGTLGIVEATVGVGAAIGAAIAIRWRPRRDAFLGFIVLLPQGAAIGVLGLPHLAAVVCAAVVIGISAGCASVLLSGAFQRSLDPAYLGRASSMTQLGDFALLPVMMPLLGWLAHATSVTIACAVFGAGMVLLSLWGTSRRALRELVPVEAY